MIRTNAPRSRRRVFSFAFSGILLFALSLPAAEAGIFNTTHFVEPGNMAFGLEPVVTFSDGAGVGANFKYTYGLTDYMDAAAIIGTGTGPQRFRLGGDLVFDFFPDVDNQPGIGLLTRAIYYQLPNSGELDVLGAPYIHKAFTLQSKDIVDPFVAIPMGIGFDSGAYRWLGQLVIGSMFQNSENAKFMYSAEVGIDLNNSESYFSGGITYYP